MPNTPHYGKVYHLMLARELRQRANDPITPKWGCEDYATVYFAQRKQLMAKVLHRRCAYSLAAIAAGNKCTAQLV